MFNKNLDECLLACSIILQKHMSDLLSEDAHDSKILDAMRYSVLSDGKRIRPFLLIITANIFRVNIGEALNCASAIEFIHVYSLIHDDLPAMDNDDLRRGIPTCHKKFNEATAILAGDALLTYAFQILSDEKTHHDSLIRCQLVSLMAKSAGFKGMVGGQMLDLEKSEQKISNEELAKLHRLKTGELFMASVEAGAIIGRASESQRNALRYYAHDLGLAFQIKDDILDHASQSTDEKINIDETNHKKKQENASIVDIVGLETAQKQLILLKDQAIFHLRIFGDEARLLREVAEFVVIREK
jgi:farnesyl diphosphate synthase